MAVLIAGIVAVTLLMAASFVDADLIMENMKPAAISVGQLRALALIAAAACLFGLVIMYHINRIFMNIHRNNTPFTEDNVRDLRVIALLVLVVTIVLPIMSEASAYAAGEAAVIGFNPFTLLMAFIIYILSLIFSYGTELQRESDETL